MHLKRLEIQGFKSFANKTTMEFSRGVISIVGPNGSGKSNVADSLRWVLGEQSTKLIRGKKADDVIFAGSDKKARMGFAEVVATFDNQDRRIPVDSAEVSIGRRIDRSGESEYLINGNKVRLLDIIDLVLKSNIGTSRYTVIGQGTIDQMILAGPSEVKNLLDEASGVKNYYIKRDKTLRRLEQTAQNLMRAEDLIAEIEPRLKSLRRQAKKMEARVEIENELKIYQREFFGKTFWQLQNQIEHFTGQLGGLFEKKNKLEEAIAEHRKILESAEQDNSGNSKQQREMQEQLGRLQQIKNKLFEDLSLVRGKMQSHKTAVAGDAKTLQVEQHQLTIKISESEKKISEVRLELQDFQNQISSHTEALSQLSGHLNNLYAKIQNPQTVDWALFDRELAGLEESFASFYAGLEQSAEIGQIKFLAQNFKNSFEKFNRLAKNNIASPQLQVLEIQQQLQGVLKQKDELTSKLQTLELNSTKSKLSIDFLEKELSQLQAQKLQVSLELKKAESASSEDFLKDLISEEARVLKEIEVLGGEILGTENIFKDFLNKQSEKQKSLHDQESLLRRQQDELSKLKDQESLISIEKAKVDTQMDVLREEVLRILGSEIFENIKQQQITEVSADLESKILRLKNQLDTIGGMDELTLKEYQETESRYTNLFTQVEDLKKGMNDLRSVMDELDEHIKTKFNEAFHKINEKFEYYFRILFNGGRAYLSLVKSDEPTEDETAKSAGDEDQANTQEQLRPEEKILQKYERGASNVSGIDIKATPPGKKLASIQALSGGERALTSIALLCSLLTCFPSPFVVLDEVDAALDDANTIRFGQILGTLAHQTQFVTITHNRETMAQASMLYGVTMGDDGISKLLSVKLDQAKQFAK
jgi:chromosome segregation protein